jgi:hypothetical protein
MGGGLTGDVTKQPGCFVTEGGGADEEGIAGKVEPISDPEAVASKAVVSIEKSEV